MKKYFKKLKNKKGTQFIEVGIGLMFFVISVAFFVDLAVIGNKHFKVGNETGRISRMISIQGGISSKAPEGFPGGENAYTNSSELYNQVKSKLENNGFTSNEWKILFTEYDKSGRVIRKDILLTPTSNFNVDYMHSMDVKLSVKYNWYIFSQIVPIMASDRTMNSERHSIGEFKFNYDDWESEENNDAKEPPPPENTDDGEIIDDGTGNGDNNGDDEYIPEDPDYGDEDITDPTGGN